MTTSNLKLSAAMLSFAGSIRPTEAVFEAWNSEATEEKVFVELYDKTLVGQTSSRHKPDKDSEKEVMDGDNNIQLMDAAQIPIGCDRFGISFDFRCLGNSFRPHVCSDLETAKAFESVGEKYQELGGYHYLASLYLSNIASARFAFRNLFETDPLRVEVTWDNGDRKIAIDPRAYRFHTREKPHGKSADEQIDILFEGLLDGDHQDIEDLVDLMADGFDNDFDSELIHVEYIAQVAQLQPVYPSQLYKEVKSKAPNVKKKFLSSKPARVDGRIVNVATMTDQKIGNAIRTIDIWHGCPEYPAIAINPFAGVSETREVLRKLKDGRAVSFYAVIDDPQTHLASLDKANSIDQVDGAVHFMMANLIRGGVFSHGDTKPGGKNKTGSGGKEAA